SLARQSVMDNAWSVVGIFMIVAIVLPGAALIMARLLGPKKPSPIKQQTYECGVETVGESWVQFKAQYYVYALAFVVFDVEVVFLYPWARAYGQLPIFATLEGALFILILAVGLLYAWRKGALEWQ
ncbi:MAG TPA: NADH-quinone oxidoreductase subunit A, partial [Anaerolineales bacterium]|nr:NADH-quinone oxidoreductase subunit A [Anaerolineales bacterium]